VIGLQADPIPPHEAEKELYAVIQKEEERLYQKCVVVAAAALCSIPAGEFETQYLAQLYANYARFTKESPAYFARAVLLDREVRVEPLLRIATSAQAADIIGKKKAYHAAACSFLTFKPRAIIVTTSNFILDQMRQWPEERLERKAGWEEYECLTVEGQEWNPAHVLHDASWLEAAQQYAMRK
jgi:hypothetical protein